MSITPYGYGARQFQSATETFNSLKDTLGTLQTQLSTGRKSDTFAGLGAGASASLRLDARLSTLEGFGSAITNAQIRVNLASTGLQQISRDAHSLATTIAQTVPSSPVIRAAGQITAQGYLGQAIDALNVDANGVYLFSGRASDKQPVVSYDMMMNGDLASGGAHAGLKQIVSERQAADRGTGGMGRLTTALAGSSVTLSEEAAALPFGFKLAGASATGTGIAAAGPTGSPAAATLSIAAQPNQGDQVSFDLTLPDGTTQTLTLTADATGSGALGTFAIGATTAATAGNLQSALNGALTKETATTLSAASALRASTDFFAGSPSSPPLRVGGTSPGGPTTYAAGTPADTVIWYRGEDGMASARETAPVQIGDNQSVAIGLRANESGLKTVLAAFGALAAGSYPETDTTTPARYDALGGKLTGILAGAGGAPLVEAMNMDLGNASSTLKKASERVSATKAQVQNLADAVETAPAEKVAAEMMATQTRLQASYQTTSAIAKLSLVDYLR